MRSLATSSLFVLTAVLILAMGVQAEIPSMINYQGRLTDSSGEPAPDGASSVHFAFYDDSVRGILLWEETHPEVQIVNGLFSVILGSIVPIDPNSCNSFFDVYVEVTVDGGEPSQPRLQLASAPSAIVAHRLVGDIETDAGTIVLKSSDGDSLIYIGSGGRADPSIYMFNPQPEPPGRPGIDLTTSATQSEIKVQYTPATRADGPLTEIRSTPESSMVLMRGPRSAAGPEAPVIALLTNADSAKVGIGTATPTEALHVIGNIALTGEVQVVTDTKLKKNIAPIDNALELVEGLRGMRYDWRRDEFKEYRLPEGRQIGLLAQDVEAVLPEIVHQDNNGYKMVAYDKIIPVLVEAIKELRVENDELRKRIEQLEN